jgi:hypothetical protein
VTVGRPGAADHLPETELRRLDDLVEEAFERADERALPVLGYGEISLVLAWPPNDPRFACKRLPVFASRERFEAYRSALEDYLAVLGAAGVQVVETELRGVELGAGQVAGYVVQPILPVELLVPAVLAGVDPEAGHPIVDAVIGTAAAVVGPRTGIDAQLSNWVWAGDGLTYIDVSTPLLWDRDGRCRLDLDLISQAFPALLRAPLRRFVAPGILDTYRDLRKVCLDVCGNLIKQRLDRWLPAFVERANRSLEEPLTVSGVERYYRSDRRLWATLLRIRRLDRAWHRRVRRRPYPFLLPRDTER